MHKNLLIRWMLLVCVGVSYANGHLPAWGSDKPTWGSPGGRSRRRFGAAEVALLVSGFGGPRRGQIER